MGEFVHGPWVRWKASEEPHPARRASWQAMNALSQKDKSAYLALYAPNGSVKDPVGPSIYDPGGKIHSGHEGLSDYWDKVIQPVISFHIVISDSFAVGDDVMNVGTMTTTMSEGKMMDVEGVFHYHVDPDGLLLSHRAFWELSRVIRTIRDGWPRW